MPTIPSTPTGSAYCTEQTTSHCVGTAALLIIGEELLSGKVADSNTALLCRGLRDVGFEVPTRMADAVEWRKNATK